MATYTDRTGDEWRIDLTVFHVDRIKRDAGVNLNDAFVQDDAGMTDLMRLARDPAQLVAVLYAASDEQVAERNLDADTFARRFDGDVIQTAIAALSEALCDFFPKRLREPMHRARRKITDRIEANQPSDDELDQIIDSAIDGVLPLRTGTSTAPSPAAPA